MQLIILQIQDLQHMFDTTLKKLVVLAIAVLLPLSAFSINVNIPPTSGTTVGTFAAGNDTRFGQVAATVSGSGTLDFLDKYGVAQHFVGPTTFSSLGIIVPNTTGTSFFVTNDGSYVPPIGSGVSLAGSNSVIVMNSGSTSMTMNHSGTVLVMSDLGWLSLTGTDYDPTKLLSIGSDVFGGVSIGNGANGSATGVALGASANGSAGGIAIGFAAQGVGNTISIGAYSNSLNGIAIGYSADGTADGFAIGYSASGNNFGMGIGTWSIGYNWGTAIGFSVDGHGLGNIAIGSDYSGGLGGTANPPKVPNGYTDTVELGCGVAQLNGGLNFRGIAISDSTGKIYAGGTGGNIQVSGSGIIVGGTTFTPKVIGNALNWSSSNSSLGTFSIGTTQFINNMCANIATFGGGGSTVNGMSGTALTVSTVAGAYAAVPVIRPAWNTASYADWNVRQRICYTFSPTLATANSVMRIYFGGMANSGLTSSLTLGSNKIAMLEVRGPVTSGSYTGTYYSCDGSTTVLSSPTAPLLTTAANTMCTVVYETNGAGTIKLYWGQYGAEPTLVYTTSTSQPSGLGIDAVRMAGGFHLVDAATGGSGNIVFMGGWIQTNY